MGFIEIIEDDETFDWRPQDPQWHESVFTLKKLSLSRQHAIRRKHTKPKRGRDETNDAAITADFLDEAIVSWQGIYVRRKTADGKTERAELPCTSATKTQLPLSISLDIVNMCVNGQPPEEEDEEAPLASTTTSDG